MLSIKQQEYLSECNHRWNLKVGATGSGKTWLDYVYVIPQRLLKMKGEGQALILGNTQGTAKRNVLEPMRDLYGSHLVTSIGHDNYATIFGQKVYVLGADNVKHVDRIRGMTLEYAYGDEITTWHPEVFQMLKSRLRCEHSTFDGTGNPESPTHYIKQFIESDADVYCQKSTIFDNPFLPDQFIDDLCKEYEGTVYYPRYILGEWTRAEGLIYPMYEEVFEEAVFDETAETVVSIDYGTQNAFGAILWKRKERVWYAVDEYYYSGRDTGRQKTDEEYANDLDAWLDTEERIKTIIDPSASSFIATLRKRNYKTIKADNAVSDGIRETATAMKKGLIKISPKMKNWKQEVAGYVWDSNTTEERPIKENDHLMDSTRYFVKTMKINKRNYYY